MYAYEEPKEIDFDNTTFTLYAMTFVVVLYLQLHKDMGLNSLKD